MYYQDGGVETAEREEEESPKVETTNRKNNFNGGMVFRALKFNEPQQFNGTGA